MTPLTKKFGGEETRKAVLKIAEGISYMEWEKRYAVMMEVFERAKLHEVQPTKIREALRERDELDRLKPLAYNLPRQKMLYLTERRMPMGREARLHDKQVGACLKETEPKTKKDLEDRAKRRGMPDEASMEAVYAELDALTEDARREADETRRAKAAAVLKAAVEDEARRAKAAAEEEIRRKVMLEKRFKKLKPQLQQLQKIQPHARLKRELGLSWLEYCKSLDAEKIRPPFKMTDKGRKLFDSYVQCYRWSEAARKRIYREHNVALAADDLAAQLGHVPKSSDTKNR